jgi:hypothetical protein
MYKYKVTALFYTDWNILFSHIFVGAEHCSSTVTSENCAIYGFDTPQTPVDLGPLVRVELLPSE